MPQPFPVRVRVSDRKRNRSRDLPGASGRRGLTAGVWALLLLGVAASSAFAAADAASPESPHPDTVSAAPDRGATPSDEGESGSEPRQSSARFPFFPPFAKVERAHASVPLPNGNVHLARGLTASFAGGRSRNYGEDQSLFQWQGEVGYLYRPWFSGGFGFRINAGEPSEATQKIKNRYFILSRFYWPHDFWTAYAGLQLGIDNLNIINAPVDSLDLRDPLRNTNASLALEIGGGWKPLPYAGLTFAHRIEGSLVGTEESDQGGALNFRTLPGVAVDLLQFSESLRESVRAFYLTTEWQFGRLILEKQSFREDFAWIFGFSLAF